MITKENFIIAFSKIEEAVKKWAKFADNLEETLGGIPEKFYENSCISEMIDTLVYATYDDYWEQMEIDNHFQYLNDVYYFVWECNFDFREYNQRVWINEYEHPDIHDYGELYEFIVGIVPNDKE
jgi:hypothetical protein